MKLEVSNKMANMLIDAEVGVQDRTERLENYKKGIAITMEYRNLTLTYEFGTWWLDNHRG